MLLQAITSPEFVPSLPHQASHTSKILLDHWLKLTYFNASRKVYSTAKPPQFATHNAHSVALVQALTVTIVQNDYR